MELIMSPSDMALASKSRPCSPLPSDPATLGGWNDAILFAYLYYQWSLMKGVRDLLFPQRQGSSKPSRDESRDRTWRRPHPAWWASGVSIPLPPHGTWSRQYLSSSGPIKVYPKETQQSGKTERYSTTKIYHPVSSGSKPLFQTSSPQESRLSGAASPRPWPWAPRLSFCKLACWGKVNLALVLSIDSLSWGWGL